jgi:hypothetical protein
MRQQTLEIFPIYMNPVDGGDIHLVPLNMSTLTQAGKPQEQVLPPSVPEEPLEPEEPEAKKQIHLSPVNPLKIIRQSEPILFGADIVKQEVHK